MGSKIFPHVRTDGQTNGRTDGRDSLGLQQLRRETSDRFSRKEVVKIANLNFKPF